MVLSTFDPEDRPPLRTVRTALRALALTVGLGTLIAGTAVALANTSVPAPDLAAIVDASVPQWNFARAVSHDACWPAAAIDAAGAQNPGATRKAWPVTGQGGCPDRYSAFPTYYSVKQCTSTEIRVVFNLYMPKDGFAGNLFSLEFGHTHDFEHVILVWTKNSAGAWVRDHLLLGRHGNHVYQAWDTAESWSADEKTAGLGLDHPRIFVGWAKHAMFNHQGGLTDLLSQFTDNEYRHADFPVWPTDLRQVTDDNAAAAQFDKYDWGSATSTPAVMSRQLCSVTADS
jgi:hypothetical protein